MKATKRIIDAFMEATVRECHPMDEIGIRIQAALDAAEQQHRRYCLTPDDDGHWYLVPADRLDAFDEYVYGAGDALLPDGVQSLSGHPRNVTFIVPQEFGEDIAL